jgi:hypothetical protein
VLDIRDKKPQWHIRSDSKLITIVSAEALSEGWHHLVGTLTTDGNMALYIDGKLVAEGTSTTVDAKPARPMYLGNGEGAAEGSAGGFSGLLDQFALYHKALTPPKCSSALKPPTPNPPTPSSSAISTTATAATAPPMPLTASAPVSKPAKAKSEPPSGSNPPPETKAAKVCRRQLREAHLGPLRPHRRPQHGLGWQNRPRQRRS